MSASDSSSFVEQKEEVNVEQDEDEDLPSDSEWQQRIHQARQTTVSSAPILKAPEQEV